MSRMPRHARGELDPQRPPTRRGAQSRADRGRAAGREPSSGDDEDRQAPSQPSRRDTGPTDGRGARDR